MVNESLGHGMGGQLLQAVATRLATCPRVEDIAACLGGGQHIIGLPQLTDGAEPACLTTSWPRRPGNGSMRNSALVVSRPARATHELRR